MDMLMDSLVEMKIIVTTLIGLNWILSKQLEKDVIKESGNLTIPNVELFTQSRAITTASSSVFNFIFHPLESDYQRKLVIR